MKPYNKNIFYSEKANFCMPHGGNITSTIEKTLFKNFNINWDKRYETIKD
ncbi:hypothetical protein HNQ74_000211 [Bartonella doshiae]|uniref:Uncharacterized protein n=2 Tax=Bartonella doshiae TaxID=33044 RepID=A0A380ZL98_BARDO|nr:hypothetical protein MCS_01146 [Bartonella doshiae NCTC 12862 = ATCC 700133]MBB6158805.1 hypothetical protein [Bartonella doshiae]SUV45786.1 Uncharacterised protein [Bartonella doshiae]